MQAQTTLRPRWTGAFTLIELMTVVSVVGVVAAIAFPTYLHARTNSEKSICLTNLREIDDAKQEWALENNKVNGDTPRCADLVPYLKGNRVPICPGKGVYTISEVGAPTICNIASHHP